LQDNKTKAQIDIESILFNSKKEAESFAKQSRPYKSTALEQAGKSELSLLGLEINFNMSSVSVINYLEKHGLGQAKLIMDTAKESVRTAIVLGVKEGENIQQLSKRIREVYLQYTDSGIEGCAAAKRIARTEMIESSNFGNHEAYLQGGIKQQSWVATFDDVLCPTCEALDGEVVGVNEAFSSGDKYPPNHPNCRCTTAPEIEE